MTMSLTATRADIAKGRSRSGTIVPIFVGWSLVVGIALHQSLPTFLGPGIADTDALTRLVRVRELLGGQPWFDAHFTRMGVPHGIDLHWSRLVDLPIAGLILLFSRFVEDRAAEQLALIAWPGLLALGFVATLVSLAQRMAGDAAIWPAVFSCTFAAHARPLFAAGQIDHHNLQLILALAVVLAFTHLERGWKVGAAAGLATAAMLGIGLETILVIALAGVAAGLMGALDPARYGRGAIGFGLALGLGTLAIYGATMPSAVPGRPACDFLSPAYLAAAVIGGFGVAGGLALSMTRGSAVVARLAIIGAAGLAAAVVAGLISPQCLRGPYAEFDTALVSRWLVTVEEARGLLSILGQEPGRALGLIAAPIIAFGIAIVGLVRSRGADRLAWAMLVAAIGLALVVAVVQIRGVVLASALAVVAAAAAIAWAREWTATRPGIIGAFALIAAWVAPQQLVHDMAWRAAFSPPARHADAAPSAPTASDPARCFDRRDFASIAGFPAARALAPSNLGPALVAYTPHAAIAGPYHRDRDGLTDSLDAFEGDAAMARAIMLRRGLDLVVLCRADGLVLRAIAMNPRGFAADLVQGRAPDWLEPIPSAGELMAWRRVR